MMKNWTINFKLPQLSAAHYWQSTQVEAPDLGRAIDKAWKVVKKRPAVKGKRIKDFTVTGSLEV